jgi:hypothetical protein
VSNLGPSWPHCFIMSPERTGSRVSLNALEKKTESMSLFLCPQKVSLYRINHVPKKNMVNVYLHVLKRVKSLSSCPQKGLGLLYTIMSPERKGSETLHFPRKSLSSYVPRKVSLYNSSCPQKINRARDSLHVPRKTVKVSLLKVCPQRGLSFL